MTLTDAINAFIQQSLNVGGMPFMLAQNSTELLKEQAIALLMNELEAGENSVNSGNQWIPEEDMFAEFGISKLS